MKGIDSMLNISTIPQTGEIWARTQSGEVGEGGCVTEELIRALLSSQAQEMTTPVFLCVFSFFFFPGNWEL